MKAALISPLIVSLFVLLAPTGLRAQATDCQPHPLFTPMQGYTVGECREAEYESYTFWRSTGESAKPSGAFRSVTYYAPSGRAVAGTQVVANHVAAWKKLGGTVTYESGRMVGSLKKGELTVWVSVEPVPDGYKVISIDEAPVVEEVKASAALLKANLMAYGYATVYDVYFDVNSATLKAESAHALTEMARLLAENPTLKVYIVGHTDMTASLEYNLRLSAERAQAVVSALVAQRAEAAGQISAQGVGPLAPVASNQAEPARKLNRRVTLVRRLE